MTDQLINSRTLSEYFDKLLVAITSKSLAVGSIQLNNSLNISGRNDYLTVNFPNGAVFRNKKLALNYLALYYAWNNIQNNAPSGFGYQNYNNSYIQYEWIDSTVNTVTFPDGMYEISDINGLLTSIMINNGHYLTHYSNGLIDNAQYTFLSIVSNVTYNAFQIISLVLPTQLANVTGTDSAPVAPTSGYLVPYITSPTTAPITQLQQTGYIITITCKNTFPSSLVGNKVFVSGVPQGGSWNVLLNNQYLTVLSVASTYITVQVATSSTFGPTTETYGTVCTWGNSLASGYGPLFIVPNTGMTTMLGFPASTYPSTFETSNYSKLSPTTPQITPIVSINVNCSLISNNYNTNFQSVFQFTPNTTFANFMSFSPSFPVYFKINDGNYSQVSIWFTDQSGYPLYITDPEIVCTLLIADAV